MVPILLKQNGLPLISNPMSILPYFWFLLIISQKKISVDPYCLPLPHFLFLCPSSWLQWGGYCGQCNGPSALVCSRLSWPFRTPNLVMRLIASTHFHLLEFRTHHTLLSPYFSGYSFSFSFAGLRLLLIQPLNVGMSPKLHSRPSSFSTFSRQLKMFFPRALNTFCKPSACIFTSLVQTSVLSC